MCSNNCFLLEQFLIVAACPGASCRVHRVLFDSKGVTFFSTIFWKSFFTQNCDCGRKTVPKWNQNEVIWSLIFRKNAKTKKCVSTAQARADCMWAHPMERPGRPQNQRKNITYFRTYFFNQIMQECEKKGSQKGPKRVSIFPGWRPWGRLGRPNLFLNTKSMPKVLQKWPPGCKSDHKMLQKWPPRSQNALLQERQSGSSASENVSCKIPGPADCAKRLQ